MELSVKKVFAVWIATRLLVEDPFQQVEACFFSIIGLKRSAFGGLFAFGQPRLSRLRRCSGFGRSHSDRERGRYFSRAANNPAQFFFCYSNRLPYQFRDTVGPEAGVVIGRVFLRQQQGLIRLALPVNVANVGSCKYSTLPFTAESYPSAVT